MSEKQIEDCGCVNFGGGGLVPKYCPKHLAEATSVTPQGTTEERFDKRFHDSCWKEGEYTKEAVKAFIQSETSLSYQRGQDDLRERMEKILERHLSWEPTAGHESEEEKGFQKGLIAEARLIHAELTQEAKENLVGFDGKPTKNVEDLEAKESNQK